MNATPEESAKGPAELEKRPATAWLIAVIVGLQAAAWAALGIWVGFLLIAGASTFLATALFELVLIGAAAVWMVATMFGILSLRPWSRASLIAIEVLQVGAAVAAFQGFLVVTWLGWVILVPAIAAVVLLFLPSMTARFAKAYQEG